MALFVRCALRTQTQLAAAPATTCELISMRERSQPMIAVGDVILFEKVYKKERPLRRMRCPQLDLLVEHSTTNSNDRYLNKHCWLMSSLRVRWSLNQTVVQQLPVMLCLVVMSPSPPRCSSGLIFHVSHSRAQLIRNSGQVVTGSLIYNCATNFSTRD